MMLCQHQVSDVNRSQQLNSLGGRFEDTYVELRKRTSRGEIMLHCKVRRPRLSRGGWLPRGSRISTSQMVLVAAGLVIVRAAGTRLRQIIKLSLVDVAD